MEDKVGGKKGERAAAIYARVSSEKQAEKDLSIPAQLKALRRYALERGWEIVSEYIDEAESAKSASRPAFQEMVAAAKKKERPFDTILVWELSRFARNREDSRWRSARIRSNTLCSTSSGKSARLVRTSRS